MRVYKERELYRETYSVKTLLRVLRSKEESIGDVYVNLIRNLYSLYKDAEVTFNGDEGRDVVIPPVYSGNAEEWENCAAGFKKSVDSGTLYDGVIKIVIEGNEYRVCMMNVNPERVTISGGAEYYDKYEALIIEKLNS